VKNKVFSLFVKIHSMTLDEEGQDLVEYALVVGLISVAAVAGLKSAGTAVTGVLSKITSSLSSAA
jgi:pilus assembly protein Flp/PilA